MSILYISNIVKKLTDNQINQIKKLIKLILRLGIKINYDAKFNNRILSLFLLKLPNRNIEIIIIKLLLKRKSGKSTSQHLH